MTDDAPQLYLATPPLDDAAAFAPLLKQALEAGDVASLLIRLAGNDERNNEAIVRALAPIAQEKGVAVLVDGGVNLALRAKADGAHVTGADDDLTEAVKKLSPKYIVGAGSLPLRDDAMRAGEAGADYVLFDDADFDTLIERVSWWAELFNTPCVARAASLDDVGALTRAGADFVMLDDAVWRAPDVGAAVTRALSDLREGAKA